MSKNKNMWRNGSKQKNNLRIMLTIFIPIFLILVIANISSAAIDCSMCHKTEPGKASIKARDTIEITDQTCLKCHNPDYPPTPIGYNTHLAHVGKYSANVDYLTKHPKATNSLSCDNCHTNIGENCQNCHTKNLPHISPPLGYNCKGCHGELDKLFQHPTIDLKIHDIFNTGDTTSCRMCHNPDNMASLRLASGETVSMRESYRLCFQCHSGYYNLWNSGSHYSNKTIPSEIEIRMSSDMGINVQEVRAGLEDEWRKENTCPNCHNPHNPRELYQLPIPISNKITHIGVVEIIRSNLLYIGIALVAIVSAVAILIIKKKKLKLSELKLSGLKKLKLPKISIPISISVEKLEDAGVVSKIEEKREHKIEHKIEAVQGIEPVHKDEEKIIDMPAKEIAPETEKKKFLYRYRKDIYFMLAMCMVFGLFYVIFGAFMPITAILSESMSPHIEKGDIIFYTDASRIDNIGTYDKKNSMNFENYGDVILYRPFGREDAVPYIHRAIYYVNQGDEMWPGGPKAPHSGYITKGDNEFTNPKYDQQGSISLNKPIKKEWIIGVARFRIPYIGYIRMILS